jgi:hypothetical protein
VSLAYQIDNSDGGCSIHFSGEIDETADFHKIDLPKVKHLVIDLKGLRLLNSSGLRSWVLWTRTLTIPLITIRNCPSVAVLQMNVLDGFLPMRAVIESFELPYLCESCGQEQRLWAQRGKDFMERMGDKAEWTKFEEEIPCPKCGKKAALDVLPLRYFSFLKARF